MATASRTVKYWDSGQWIPVLIRAEYQGGQYIELRFGMHRPSEVINVFDYREGKPVIERTNSAVTKELVEWIAENDRVEIEDRPGIPLGREWLKVYLENA